MLNLAIIGAGEIARRHVNGFALLREKGLKGLQVRSIVDLNEENAKSLAKIIGGIQGFVPRIYTSTEKMLREESDVQAVYICVPHSEHHRVAIPCIEEGMHIFIEKPLGITMRAAWKIAKAAQNKGVVLAVAENFRRFLRYRLAKVVLDRLLIGVPRFVFWIDQKVFLDYWGWRHHKLMAGGGWTLDYGVHTVDVLRFLLGEPYEVYAVTRLFEPQRIAGYERKIQSDVEDTMMSVIKFSNGIVVNWSWSDLCFNVNDEWNYIRLIYASDGSMHLEKGFWIRSKRLFQPFDREDVVKNLLAMVSPKQRSEWFPLGFLGKSWDDVFAIELYDFIKAINGERKPEVDAMDGLRDQAVVFSVYESSVLNEPVRVEDVLNLKLEEYQKEINEKLSIS